MIAVTTVKNFVHEVTSTGQEAEMQHNSCYAEINGHQLTQQEHDDLMNRQPVKSLPRAKGFSGRAFSILR